MTEQAEPVEATAPAVSITETPEFKAALAAATQAAVAELRAGLMNDVVAAMAKQGVATDVQSQASLISDLTVAIASMTDTGGNRKVIAPADAAKRLEAWKRMGEVLERVNKDPDARPHYQIVAEMQLEEQLIQKYVPAGEGKWKQNEIIWRGAPNSGMRPMNAIAKEIFNHYLESIGGSTANQAGIRDQPTWVSYGGLQFVGNPTQSAANRGLVTQPAEPMELGHNLHQPTKEITSVDDPGATKIPILGKTFAPAERADPVNQKLQFPAN